MSTSAPTGGGHWVSSGDIYKSLQELRDDVFALKTTIKILSYIVMPALSAVIAVVTNTMLGN